MEQEMRLHHVRQWGLCALTGLLIGLVGSAWAIDPSNPPATLRGTVLKDGQIRTFNLQRKSFRGENFGVFFLLEDGRTLVPIDPGPVRTYLGWCEEESDSLVEATLLPNGDLRYHVFKGNATDWWYRPPFESGENGQAVNNFTPLAGNPQRPSGQPYPTATFTTPAAGLDAVYKTVYQADVGFDVLVDYLNATSFSDLSLVRKAENAISHFNGFFVRDLLLEVQLGKVVFRTSNEGLTRPWGNWGVDWINFGAGTNYWAALFAGVDHHFVSVVGNVGGGVAYVCDYDGPGRAARSFVGWSSSTGYNWWHVARHELGHNLGASDWAGGSPEGPTFMSGNNIGVSRASRPEVEQIVSCRRNKGHVMRTLGSGAFPVPPYAQLDKFDAIAGVPQSLDVLANDYDANGDAIAIASFDTTTSLGGTVTFSAGTGPNERDVLLYSPPAGKSGTDAFQYIIVDRTGRTSIGNIQITVLVAQFESHPLPVTVPAGAAQAQFTVSAINADTYQWYKDGAPLAPNPTHYTGQDTATLTLFDVQIADEGVYHCVLSNQAGSVASKKAPLVTERLIGWWRFNGDLTDSVQKKVPGSRAHHGAMDNPVFVTDSVAGRAIRFERNDGRCLTIPASGDFFNFYPNGLTVSFWYKPDNYSGLNGYMSLISKISGAGWRIYDTAFYAGQGLECNFGGVLSASGRLDEGNWHLVTLTYDGQTVRLYRDGVQQNSAARSVRDFNSTPITIGATPGSSPVNWEYRGLIDEVRIYSYPLSAQEIASMYEQYLRCGVDNPSLRFDFNGDCRLDIVDFAIFISDWLNCGLYPDCY